MEWHHGEYTLTDEPARADLRAICSLLAGTYWAKERAPEAIERSVRNSMCFSLLHGGKQVGLTRVVTDRATVGYLCDVIIADDHRGRGLGKWMLATILEHPDLRGCRIDLFTGDAQEFYRAFGFGPHRYTSMVRYPPDYAGGSGSDEGRER
jgi:GNAT superfamily N-acetyltransferase